MDIIVLTGYSSITMFYVYKSALCRYQSLKTVCGCKSTVPILGPTGESVEIEGVNMHLISRLHPIYISTWHEVCLCKH